MKIPITDQFLLDVFYAMSKTEDILRFIIHPPRTWKSLYLDTSEPNYQKYYKMLKPKRFAKLIYHLKKNNYIKVKNLETRKAIIITKKDY